MGCGSSVIGLPSVFIGSQSKTKKKLVMFNEKKNPEYYRRILGPKFMDEFSKSGAALSKLSMSSIGTPNNSPLSRRTSLDNIDAQKSIYTDSVSQLCDAERFVIGCQELPADLFEARQSDAVRRYRAPEPPGESTLPVNQVSRCLFLH